MTASAPQTAPSLAGKLLRLPFLLLFVLALVAAIGVATLEAQRDGATIAHADHQLVRLLLAAMLMLTAALVPPSLWRRAAYPLYFAALALVLLVPAFGVIPAGAGAKRWLVVAGMSLQPSEFIRIALVLALARYFHALPAEKLSRPAYLLAPAAMIAAPMLPVLMQPDLGTALLLAMIGTGLMFLAGVALPWFIALGVALAGSLPLAWNHLHDYQRERIFTFLDPERDPLGTGYHLLQSKIAIGSAGLWGKGYGRGTQGRLDFLPEKHTDFIFAMFTEERGLIGAVGLIGLYAFAFLLLLVMAAVTRQVFGRLVIAGMAGTLGIYVFINIGMVMGLLPVVGVPLPLFSYGGTSALTLMLGLGVAASAFVHRGWADSW